MTAIHSWSNIQHVKLANVFFPKSFENPWEAGALFPAIPTLRTLYIGQVVFLNPFAVAAFLLLRGMPSLERVSLVDAYAQSIWGLRIRRSDVEQAALQIGTRMGTEDVILHRVRSVLRCERMTERIIGGDREDTGLAVD